MIVNVVVFGIWSACCLNNRHYEHKLEICVCLLKLKVLLLLEVFDDLLRLVVDIVLCCNEDELLFGFDKVEYSFNFVFLNVVKRLPGL